MEAALQLDIPTPKYRIGQTVYVPRENSTAASHPCPDCLGSRRWKVITPAGTELSADCQRCGNYSNSQLPSLKYQTWVACVETLTIGSVRIDTAAGHSSWRDDPVQYMCRETGIGSGSIYNEGKLYATEAEAQVAAEAMVAKRNTEAAGTPQRLEQQRLSSLLLKDAEIDQFKTGLWNSWYRFRELRNQVDEWVKDETQSVERLREDIKYEQDFNDRHPGERQLFEKIIRAAAKTDDPELLALINALPFKPLADKESETAL